MSYFDPHRLYYHSNRKTHKGQIIQKRFVDHDSAFTKEDLDRSFRVLKAYGYYFSRNPPVNPIIQTISFNLSRLFLSDSVLSLSEIVNSTLRAHINGLDPDFLSTDPSEIKHFYCQIAISCVTGTVPSDTSELRIQLFNGVDITASFNNSVPSYITIIPSSDSQIHVIHSPSSSAGYELDAFPNLDLGNVALVTIAIDDVDFYSMLFNNDFSQLADEALISLSSGTFAAKVNFTFTYVNFD